MRMIRSFLMLLTALALSTPAWADDPTQIIVNGEVRRAITNTASSAIKDQKGWMAEFFCNNCSAAAGAGASSTNQTNVQANPGSDAVKALSIQGITGGKPVPVSGSFWQTTQPVSGTFWQTTQPVSGTFWQATQPVSLASQPLPTGASTETTLAALNTKTPSLGQNTMSGSTPVVLASDQSAISVNTKSLDNVTVAFTSASSAATLFTADTNNYGGVAFQITGTWSGTISFEASNDNTNFSNATTLNSTLSPATSTTSNNIFYYNGGARYFRARVSTYTSGTVTGVSFLRQMPPNALASVALAASSSTIGYTGGAGTDLATYAQQAMTAGCYAASAPAATTAGFKQRVNCGLAGNVWETPFPVADAAAAIAPVTSTAVSAINAKGTAGNVYGLNVDNGTTAGYIIVYNSASAITGGTALTASLVLWHYAVGASASFDKAFPVPINATAGIQILFSTSLTTYTAPGTTPTYITYLSK